MHNYTCFTWLIITDNNDLTTSGVTILWWERNAHVIIINAITSHKAVMLCDREDGCTSVVVQATCVTDFMIDTLRELFVSQLCNVCHRLNVTIHSHTCLSVHHSESSICIQCCAQRISRYIYTMYFLSDKNNPKLCLYYTSCEAGDSHVEHVKCSFTTRVLVLVSRV